MRICIFGGSFNPIHIGHIALARTVVQAGLADKVWLMVSPHNPLKAADALWDDDLRLKLARIAAEKVEGVEVSDFEFHLPRPSYTYATLTALHQAYPEHEFRILIGADNWAVFDHWRNAQEIIAEYGVIIYPRPGFDLTPSQVVAPNITVIHAPIYDVSSTSIRQSLDRGEDISHLVPEGVALAIAQNR